MIVFILVLLVIALCFLMDARNKLENTRRVLRRHCPHASVDGDQYEPTCLHCRARLTEGRVR